MKLGILNSQEDFGEHVRFLDADWAGDIKDRKSTSGYVFQISGAAVTWRSKKQGYVARVRCSQRPESQKLVQA